MLGTGWRHVKKQQTMHEIESSKDLRRCRESPQSRNDVRARLPQAEECPIHSSKRSAQQRQRERNRRDDLEEELSSRDKILYTHSTRSLEPTHAKLPFTFSLEVTLKRPKGALMKCVTGPSRGMAVKARWKATYWAADPRWPVSPSKNACRLVLLIMLH